LDNFLEITVIANAFRGIKIAVGILILSAAVNMLKIMKKTGLSVSIVVCACVAMLVINVFSLNFSSIALMLIAGAVSLTAFALHRKGGGA
ncbi:hypothetical protein NYY73_18205, partial [Acinetobacter baumannii]|nr:hypothetical protein [Acinetobacter baumannii]